MQHTLEIAFNLCVVVFVVATMVSMGLGLRLSQIIQPLKKLQLVVGVLVTNFLFVPLATLGLAEVLGVDEGTKIALVILSLSAGAPFLPKLAEIAKKDTALATAVMLLLMVSTVVVLPLALPFFIHGSVEVDSYAIAKSLVLMMILPLVLALVVKAKNDVFAQKYQPKMVQLSNITLLAIVVIMSILHAKAIMGIFGLDMVAIVLFMILALFIGYKTGGDDVAKKVVSSLAAGQRNISAALVVWAQNFGENPKVSIVIIAVSIIGLFILLFSAKQYQKKG